MKITSKILVGCVTSIAFLLPDPSFGAGSKEARVTQIIREVKLLPADKAAHEAALNDKVSEDTGVRTGGDSRSELTFPDLTITRLGANTVFSFTKSGRTATDRVDPAARAKGFRRRLHQEQRHHRRCNRNDGDL
jgi:hypothetical protein